VYRIALAASVDGGATWAPRAVVAEGPTGLWEPCLYLTSAGGLRVAYSAELANGGEQDIVQRGSPDGGRTWGPPQVVAHTPGSRNGMPGVARLGDGSWA
jgi:hypothetical protein